MSNSDLEHADLWEAWLERGCIESRDKLAEHYIYLLHRTAGKMVRALPSHVHVEDLISYGALGMMRALDNFDPSMGKKFGTYAVASIRGTILDELRSIDWAPKSLRKKERDIAEARRTLQHSTLEEPSTEAVADHMGLTPEAVRETQWRLGNVNHDSVENLREYIGWDAPSDEDTESSVVVNEAQEVFLGWLDEQPYEDQVLIALCYYERLTLIDASRRMGVPEPAVVSRHTRLVLDLRSTLTQVLTNTEA